MASSKKDYFGLGWLLSLILAIIPVTSWILGALTRFSEGKLVAGVIRLFLGFTIIWVLDIICMLFKHSIARIINI
ncbi:MAG: hypothetical protein KBS59_07950 [Clostridiales bacterium]|nr:hypothetical protein [Clostridiales bacterium]